MPWGSETTRCCYFHTAKRTLEGVESMHTMRKGQVKRRRYLPEKAKGRWLLFFISPGEARRDCDQLGGFDRLGDVGLEAAT